MKKQFVNLNGLRVKSSAIKKYKPLNDTEVAMHFTPSSNLYETESVKFDNEKLRDEFVSKLDLTFDSSFITIKDTRVRLGSIAKYKSLNGIKIVLYYNTSKKAPLSEIFEFETTKDRDEILLLIDINTGVA